MEGYWVRGPLNVGKEESIQRRGLKDSGSG